MRRRKERNGMTRTQKKIKKNASGKKEKPIKKGKIKRKNGQ
jgi:hypothetical protein